MLGEMLVTLAQVDQWIDSNLPDVGGSGYMANDWARVSAITSKCGDLTSALWGDIYRNQSISPPTDNAEITGRIADVVITGILALLHFTKDESAVGVLLIDKTRDAARQMVADKRRAGQS